MRILAFLIISGMTIICYSAPEISPCLSMRYGFNYVDSHTPDDALNGRDYLSRVGVKLQQELSNGWQSIGKVEYGDRSDNKVDIKQNEGLGVRQYYLGLSKGLHSVRAGSQFLIWHKLVRSPYFSSGSDTLTQGTARDDDLIQYYYSSDDFKFASGIQAAGQDGDSFDQLQLGGELAVLAAKIQWAISHDNNGPSRGNNLYGIRVTKPTKDLRYSVFYHHADQGYDLYKGSNSGTVRVTEGEQSGNIRGVPDCDDQQRYSIGIFVAGAIGGSELKSRIAKEHCYDSGAVSSLKLEYIASISKNYKIWISSEFLANDKRRRPESSSMVSMSEYQIGLRWDIF